MSYLILGPLGDLLLAWRKHLNRGLIGVGCAHGQHRLRRALTMASKASRDLG